MGFGVRKVSGESGSFLAIPHQGGGALDEVWTQKFTEIRREEDMAHNVCARLVGWPFPQLLDFGGVCSSSGTSYVEA